MSHVPRPHSMCGRGLSPPIASMPISPASDICSSDSAGSSPSMDDCGENIMEEGTVSRYGHSLTPDEPVILDKKGDDYALWSTSHPHLKYSLNFKSHSPSQVSLRTSRVRIDEINVKRKGSRIENPLVAESFFRSRSRGNSLINGGWENCYSDLIHVTCACARETDA